MRVMVHSAKITLDGHKELNFFIQSVYLLSIIDKNKLNARSLKIRKTSTDCIPLQFNRLEDQKLFPIRIYFLGVVDNEISVSINEERNSDITLT